MTDLERLLERVEGLAGPSESADLELSRIALGVDAVIRYSSAHQPYTSSLDAIVGLISIDLPGWQGKLDFGEPYVGDGKFKAWLLAPDGDGAEGICATPALSCCAAYLRAKLALPQKESGE